jgi:UDP-N-acetylbacillosamine N-acetyltransferase
MIVKELVIFGYSGHALVIADCLTESLNLTSYIAPIENHSNTLGLKYLGDESIQKFEKLDSNTVFFPAMGANQIRKKVCDLITNQNLSETTIIHPSSIISKSVTIEASTLIGPGAIINAGAKIGRGVIINSGAVVEHECKLSDYVHIAPNATITGNVSIGSLSFIGAGAVVAPNINIGSNVIIGAGAVVLKDIGDNETWVGNPARKI